MNLRLENLENLSKLGRAVSAPPPRVLRADGVLLVSSRTAARLSCQPVRAGHLPRIQASAQSTAARVIRPNRASWLVSKVIQKSGRWSEPTGWMRLSARRSPGFEACSRGGFAPRSRQPPGRPSTLEWPYLGFAPAGAVGGLLIECAGERISPWRCLNLHAAASRFYGLSKGF